MDVVARSSTGKHRLATRADDRYFAFASVVRSELIRIVMEAVSHKAPATGGFQKFLLRSEVMAVGMCLRAA